MHWVQTHEAGAMNLELVQLEVRYKELITSLLQAVCMLNHCLQWYKWVLGLVYHLLGTLFRTIGL